MNETTKDPKAIAAKTDHIVKILQGSRVELRAPQKQEIINKPVSK